MAHVHGYQAKLYINDGTWVTPDWEETPNVRDCTVNLDAEEADATTRAGGGWKQTAQALRDASVEFEMVWDTADTDFQKFLDAYTNNTTIEVAAMSGAIASAGSEGLRADMVVTQFTRQEALNDILKVSVVLKPARTANTPTWMVIS